MKFKLTLITITGVFLLSSFNLKAQNNTNDFTPSHLKAAERVLIASGLQGNIQKMFGQIFALESKQLPEKKRAAYTVVMNKFVDKYANWEQIKAAFVPIYASEFTEDELNQIADFLSSPAGQAMTSKQVILMQKGAEWGMQLAKDHQLELEQMMKDAMPKTEK